jgi:hypothetical protein
MALEILLEITSITADRSEGLLTDNTVYGAPEVVRADGGVYVTGQKMKSDSTVDSTLTLTGDTADPQLDSSWTFNIPKDGWFRFLYVWIPDYNGATTYAQYEAVQNAATSVVYRSLVAGNVGNALTDVNFWEVISDPGSLALNKGEANESANIESIVYSVVLIPNAEYEFANAISEASEECCNVNCSLDDLFEYIRLMVMVDGCYVRSDRSQFAQAERIARRLEAITE